MPPQTTLDKQEEIRVNLATVAQYIVLPYLKKMDINFILLD